MADDPLQTSVISEALGYYCLSSWSPQYFHVYMSLLVSISVSIAMYCVVSATVYNSQDSAEVSLSHSFNCTCPSRRNWRRTVQ